MSSSPGGVSGLAAAHDVRMSMHGGFARPPKPLDPRAERILELADARRMSGRHVLLARCLREAVADVWEKPLTMNVAMPIAAVMLDLGFSSAAVKAVPILARTAAMRCRKAFAVGSPARKRRCSCATFAIIPPM